ncbi:MAG: hypothetical protein WKF34_06535 [Pyrinomonadaceae bacterium]
MRIFTIVLVTAALACAASAQDTKSKAKATQAKSALKSKSADTKSKASAAKKPALAKAAPKPSTIKKPATTAKAKSPTPNPTSKLKAATPAKKLDEKGEWAKAAAIADATGRLKALKKFAAAFPASEKKIETLTAIATIEATLGNGKMAAGDLAGAATHFLAAAQSAPQPLPDALFNETLSKIPVNLFFRGARAEAYEIAKMLEEKSSTSVSQTLGIATFYMSVENGTEARRVAEKAIKLDAASSAAYQTLGLATRMDFMLEESAAGYSKALEIEPDSLSARRGLAEMRRALGRPEEAIALYREILAKEPVYAPAQTGLILALFDADKRVEAEAEMGKSLEANPGNIILLAGAAYWYATRGEGDRAVELAQKAIAADPRFIWSHIALARGHLVKKDPTAAEKTLLAARRYGNFPTLEYEIASAKMQGGLYREAAEELVKSFVSKDGTVQAKLGGRVARESKNLGELIGYERRASIFAPTAADSPENAARLTALLELKQELEVAEPRGEVVANAVDNFVRGDDAMKIHRQIFAATQLLDKKVAGPKLTEILKAAPASLEAGLDAPNAATAVMASQLYESRSVAAARGEYVNVPEVPRTTLSAIMRGQIEELSGWAAFQTDKPDEAVVRLKRAASVSPVESAWWRSSTWRLARALAQTGKDAEALEWYVKSYKGSAPNGFSYGVIEAIYKKVNGTTDGLEAKIGPNPAMPASGVVAAAEPLAGAVSPMPRARPPIVTPAPRAIETPPSVPVASPSMVPVAVPSLTPEPTPEPTPTATPMPEVTAQPTPESTPVAVVVAEPSPESSPTPLPVTTEASPQPSPSPEAALAATKQSSMTAKAPIDLFPPVVINIPPPVVNSRPANTASEVKPCSLRLSEESVTLQKGGGDLAVIVGRTDDADLVDLTAVSTSPDDVKVRREVIAGVRSRALFVLSSTSEKTGVFQVRFGLACGSRDVNVRVR